MQVLNRKSAEPPLLVWCDPQTKEPVAVLILNACRYDIGCRLAEIVNQGEPIKRAYGL